MNYERVCVLNAMPRVATEHAKEARLKAFALNLRTSFGSKIGTHGADANFEMDVAFESIRRVSLP